MRIMGGKALTHFYMLQESLILCKNGHILLSLIFKENTISDFFLLYTHYRKYLSTREQTFKNVDEGIAIVNYCYSKFGTSIHPVISVTVVPDIH